MNEQIPNSFFWKRMHSIMGLWLSIFLVEHLLTNSQAALFLGEDGHGFIHAVNWIHDLPYLPLIEIAVLGIPILIHTLWGIQYARTARFNSFKTNGTSPSLPEYPRNKAFTWQRITAWILVLGILGHVIQMRFLEYPHSVHRGTEKLYMVRVTLDQGLYTLAQRLGISLYDQDQIRLERAEVGPPLREKPKGLIRTFIGSLKDISKKPEPPLAKEPGPQLQAQKLMQEREWVAALEKKPLKNGQIIAVAHDFGSAELLMVRDTFKSPSMIALYTLFVLAACFHGFNGLWTFMITWGVTLSARSQTLMLRFSTGVMILVSFLGLAAIWLTYWINLRT